MTGGISTRGWERPLRPWDRRSIWWGRGCRIQTFWAVWPKCRQRPGRYWQGYDDEGCFGIDGGGLGGCPMDKRRGEKGSDAARELLLVPDSQSCHILLSFLISLSTCWFRSTNSTVVLYYIQKFQFIQHYGVRYAHLFCFSETFDVLEIQLDIKQVLLYFPALVDESVQTFRNLCNFPIGGWTIHSWTINWTYCI